MRVVLAGMIMLLATAAEAGEYTYGPYPKPARGETVQCLITNDDTRDLYVIAEWIECTNPGTVEPHPGQELVPGQSLTVVSSDPRACRCHVFADGKVAMLYTRSISANPSVERIRELRARLGGSR